MSPIPTTPSTSAPLWKDVQHAPETGTQVWFNKTIDALAAVKPDTINNDEAWPGPIRQKRSTGSSPPSQRPRRCYYPLAHDTAADVFKGKALKGTRAYERFVHTLIKTRKTSGNAPIGRQEAEALLDEMLLKQGMVLIAECHDTHTEADRVLRIGHRPPSNETARAPGTSAVPSPT